MRYDFDTDVSYDLPAHRITMRYSVLKFSVDNKLTALSQLLWRILKRLDINAGRILLRIVLESQQLKTCTGLSEALNEMQSYVQSFYCTLKLNLLAPYQAVRQKQVAKAASLLCVIEKNRRQNIVLQHKCSQASFTHISLKNLQDCHVQVPSGDSLLSWYTNSCQDTHADNSYEQIVTSAKAWIYFESINGFWVSVGRKVDKL